MLLAVSYMTCLKYKALNYPKILTVTEIPVGTQLSDEKKSQTPSENDETCMLNLPLFYQSLGRGECNEITAYLLGL